MKQLCLIRDPVRKEFGGADLRGRRKSARPLSAKNSLHLVLKATHSFALLRSRKTVETTMRSWAEHFGVKIYGVAVNADHIHVHLRCPSRLTYVRWIRAATSRLVAEVRGLRFALRPYSRIVSWGRDSLRVSEYLLKNEFEANLVLMAWRLARGFRGIGRARWARTWLSVSVPGG